jgi:hypothetical protein
VSEWPRRSAGLLALLSATLLALASPAGATPAQGYALSLTPVAHQGSQWLLVRAAERSDPNTATANAVLPSMLKERAWWLAFDGNGHQRCKAAAVAADAAPGVLWAAASTGERTALLERLRKVCGAALAGMPSWLGAEPAATWRWSAKQVCAGERCVPASAPQRSLDSARSQAAEGAAAAPARCVASRWLIVANSRAEDGSGQTEGARFPGLPPAVRSDIVGFESVRIDGITTLPAALKCP